jgi:hypothetical protein
LDADPGQPAEANVRNVILLLNSLKASWTPESAASFDLSDRMAHNGRLTFAGGRSSLSVEQRLGIRAAAVAF